MRNNDIVPCFDDEGDDSLAIELAEVPEVPGCLRLSLAGYIDTYNSPRFQKRVRLAVDSGFVRLIFDCTRLGYVSSAGIGTFVAFLKAVRPAGDIVLTGIQPKVQEVFHILGFSRFFNIREGLQEAVEYFAAERPQGFPEVLQCPACAGGLRAETPGRFLCSHCGAVLTVDADGSVSLG